MELKKKERKKGEGRKEERMTERKKARRKKGEGKEARTNERMAHLLLVSHGAFSPHHNLAARLGLQLFGSQAAGPQDSSHKIKLWRDIKKVEKTIEFIQLKKYAFPTI